MFTKNVASTAKSRVFVFLFISFSSFISARILFASVSHKRSSAKPISLNPFIAVVIVWLLLLSFPITALAQSAAPTVVRDFYSTPGLNPFEERINDNFNESISPFNGILQFTSTDIYLPGNGGMDLRVVRRYQSSVEDRRVKQVYGYGWDISYGELRYSTANVLNSDACTTAAGLFDTKDNPVFITPEGSSEMMVDNDGSMGAATDAILVSKGRYKLGCEPAELPATGNVWVVYSPNGMRYELGFESPVADITGRFKLFVTKISDPNGNSIEIEYAINAASIVYITSVYDSEDGRTVNFSYIDINTNDIRLESIDSGTQLWNYEYQSIYDYNDAAGALNGFLSYPDYDNYHLLRVVRPDGEDWIYEYYTEELVPGETSIYQNWHHLIREVNYPYGGNIQYEYQDTYFGEASPFYADPHQVIKTKTVNTIGADRISNTANLSTVSGNVWTYSFFPGQGGLAGSVEQIGDLTVVQTPVSIESYLHYGYEHTVEGDIWKIGLLIAKAVYNEQDEALYVEQNAWAPQAISTEAYWNGRDPNFRDSETRASLLINKQITQHGLLYSTDYNNHDGFGNPINVVRSGSSVTDTIDTTFGYFIDTDLWILSRPKDETTVDVGTVSRLYDDKGNLEQQSNYGVVTNFTYTPEGDLSTETDANDEVTVYSDYYRGIPRRTEYPENKIITRVVNTTGTVKSETSGRGFKTSYGYDVMDRLTSVDYPVHSDVTISYTTDNSRLVRTLTRGNYRETTRFSNLMNPVQIDKTDLTTGTTITIVNEFDILGRQTFVSKPTYGNYPTNLDQAQRDQFGITTILDALGREVQVRNPDDTQRFTAYHNKGGGNTQPEAGSVAITDERGNVTINRFIGYGSPEDNRLVRIEAPENMTTTAEYDKLRNITRIWQGEQGGSGHERLYNFDSRFFLESEDHPEIGHVVFGRDAVGNMISRQVKNSDVPGSTLPDSGVTIFDYDRLNRLKIIDYPGGTPDVIYTYDADDNVKAATNSNSSRTYDYDENGNLTTENITIGTENYSLGYGYNNLDYLDTLTYPSSRAVIYENDAFGRPTRIVNYIDQVTYFPGGQKEAVLYANGMSTTFSLNNRDWVESITLDNSEESGLIDLGYLYDGRGNVEQIIDGLDINSRTMTYDGLDRLKTADGMWGSGTFDYDHEDNMTARSIAGGNDIYVVSNNKMAQLQRNGSPYITPPYDVYGNQLKTATRDLLFDDASNLVRAQVVQGQVAPDVFFNYDGNNRRVAKKIGLINPDTKHYIHSKGDVVFSEVDFAANTTKENIYLGSQVVASTTFDSSDPVAVISLPASALEKAMVTLDGTGSFDPDGTIEAYEWSQVSGTSVTLVDLGGGIATFESPIVVLDERLVFQLVVRDDNSNASSTVAGIDIQQTDADGDGLSDLWEEIYFPGDLSQLGGGDADIDNDGFTDLEEFQNGTHPVQFDRLDAPDGILVSTGIGTVDLTWPAVQRATRYAVYSSMTPVVPITESNRTYTSSSPFVQEDLNNGQYLYYVIVAERLDLNGNLLGDSPTSDTITVKVGWEVWPQRIILSTQYVTATSLEINDRGDVLASWEEFPVSGEGSGAMMYASYTQQGGWAAAGSTAPVKSLNDPNVRIVEQSDGIYAEYYIEGTGWANTELLQGGVNFEWYLHEASFNARGEGLVLIGDSGGAYISLQYAPQTGWSSAQTLTLTPPTGGSVLPGQLFFADDGVAQLLLFEVDGSNFSIGAITYDSTNGWYSQLSLGLSISSLVSASASGHLHLVSPNASPALTSRHYTPGVGWSDVLEVVDLLVVGNDSFYGKQMDFEINNQGDGVLVYRETAGTGFTLREFKHAGGWQAAVIRPDPTGCDYDDYGVGDDFFSNGPSTRRDFVPDYFASLDLEINDYGDWSVVTALSDYSPRSSAMFVARRDPRAGWLDTVILHCPYLHYGVSDYGDEFSHVMNENGTTFVIWPYADNGEVLSNPKVLSSKFEMLKGTPPVANAGADQMVTEGEEVILDASLSSDIDNEISGFVWTQLSGTAVNIANADTELASFIAPLVSADETLTFEVKVTDDTGNQATDTVNVIVENFSSTELGVVLSSSSAGPLTVGEILSLSAQAAGGTGGTFEYQFRYKSLDEASASWNLLQDFGSVAGASFDSAGLGGKYRLQVRAREVGNEAIVVKDSISMWVNSIAPLTGVDLVSDAIGPQLEGFAAALTATPASSADPVEYRFELKNTAISPDWVLLHDYATDPTLNWNSGGYHGKNKLRVSARKAGTLDLAVSDKVILWVNAPDAVTSVLLTPSLFSPQPSGTGVTFDADITGGNGSVEYRFSVKDTETLAEWITAQDWSSLSSFAWDTTGIYGKQRVRVEARKIGSNDRAVKDKMSYWLNDNNPLTAVDLQIDQHGVIVVGPTINLNASPAGATNLYEYQFRVKGAAPGANWSILRDFDADPSFQIASTAYLGKNKFQVRARNQGSQDQEVKDNEIVWVNSTNAITDVALSGSNTNVLWGETVSFNLSLTGGDGTFYMAKEIKNPGEKFSGNEYFRPMTTTSFEFNVGGMMPGTYRMRVQVINNEKDKPVKSNSVKFTVSSNTGLGWQIGGENYDDIQSCNVYECPCTVIGGCYNDENDTGVFGGGY